MGQIKIKYFIEYLVPTGTYFCNGMTTKNVSVENLSQLRKGQRDTTLSKLEPVRTKKFNKKEMEEQKKKSCNGTYIFLKILACAIPGLSSLQIQDLFLLFYLLDPDP